MKHHFLLFLAYGSLIACASLVFLFNYWQFYHYKVIDYKTPYKMEKNTVVQGEYTSYSIEYNKYLDLDPIVKKYFVDGIVYQVEEQGGNLPVGCHRAVVSLHIPENLPPGMYKVRATAIYQLNPIRTYSVTNETEEFKVIESEAK